jgi:uncharacterized membrane protein HdeD (DUF308 family)
MGVPPAPRPPRGSSGYRLAATGRWPLLAVGEGALGMVVGVVVLTWPGPTAEVLATLFSIQLLTTGVLQLVAAASGATTTAARALAAGLGTLSVLVGLLCLRAPLQTTVVLGLLIGIAWVLGGVLRIAQGVSAPRGTPRGWRTAGGVWWVLAGGVVLEYPAAGLVALASVLGIVLIVEGACLVAVGLTVRRAGGPAPDELPVDVATPMTTAPPVPPTVRL